MAVNESFALVDWPDDEETLLAEVLRHNQDLADRIAVSGVTVDYNGEADLLWVTIGTPTEAITEGLADGVGLRLNPQTMRIVCLDVLSAHEWPSATVAALLLTHLAIMSHEGSGPGSAPHELYQQLAGDILKLLRHDSTVTGPGAH